MGTSPNANGAVGRSAREGTPPGEDATIVASRPAVTPSLRTVASRAAQLPVQPLLEELPVELGQLGAPAVEAPAPAEPFVHDRTYLALKRALDVVATGAALVLLAPLFAVIALLIKLEDRGPVFFAQTRVGKGGRHFRFWKFRSMVVDAERLKAALKAQAVNEQVSDRLRFKMARDPRVTRVGRWLRRFSLDELPQLWNVFRGDMTLVGPRPPIPEEVAEYGPRDHRRLELEQGLTCLWQVSGRNLLSFERQVELDIEYGRRRGLLFDLSLLLRTVPAVLTGRGAC